MNQLSSTNMYPAVTLNFPFVVCNLALAVVDALPSHSDELMLHELEATAEKALDSELEKLAVIVGGLSAQDRSVLFDDAWHLWFMDGIVSTRSDMTLMAFGAHDFERRLFGAGLLERVSTSAD